jgi:hypothetical protein
MSRSASPLVACMAVAGQIYFLHQVLGYEVKEDEMNGACSTHGEMRNARKIWLENLKGCTFYNGGARFPCSSDGLKFLV